MISLNPAYITQSQTTTGTTVTSTAITDTLYVSQFAIDFNLGVLYATIQRGTVTDGTFVSNQPPYIVTVQPDGSFVTANGTYNGTLPGVSFLVSSLSGQMDEFILASGLVTGTEITA